MLPFTLFFILLTSAAIKHSKILHGKQTWLVAWAFLVIPRFQKPWKEFKSSLCGIYIYIYIYIHIYTYLLQLLQLHVTIIFTYRDAISLTDFSECLGSVQWKQKQKLSSSKHNSRETLTKFKPEETSQVTIDHSS